MLKAVRTQRFPRSSFCPGLRFPLVRGAAIIQRDQGKSDQGAVLEESIPAAERKDGDGELD
jgi:hypothetical protein